MSAILETHADKWQPEPNTGCYVWTGQGDGSANDRPRILVDGRKKTVARLICEEVYGPCPAGHEAAHSTPNGCIGGSCVNDAHLRWATKSANQLDMPTEARRARSVWANVNNRGARYLAREAGLTHYETGKPCLRGHISRRHVDDGRCLECRKDRLRLKRSSNFA